MRTPAGAVPYGQPRPHGRSILDRPAQPDPAAPPPVTGGDQRSWRWWLPAAMAIVLVVTAVVAYRWGTGDRPPAAAPTTAEIYAAVAPSVVSIEARDASGGGSAGTGVIVNADAMILTALHVVNGASAVRVVFGDGTRAEAAVVGADPATDIAVLQPAALPSVVVPAVLGSAARLAVGDPVIAIGDQLGLTRSATEGVVSGLDRGAPGQDGTPIVGLIQFDAAVNHGSSGGPLVNAAGETVGIVVALANPTPDGTFIGIGFAVPIGVAVAAGGGDVPQ